MRAGFFAWVVLSAVLGCASRQEPADQTVPRRDGSAGAPPAEASPAENANPEPTSARGQWPAPTPEAVVLSASDGTKVHGVFYGVQQDKPRPIVLLFHQARSNAAEYEPIAPRLNALGYNALAIDQRSGGMLFGRENRTVEEAGGSTDYLPAYLDLEAALRWAIEQGHPRIVALGSSYSAALVFELAAEHGRELTAVVAFSPGEYIGKSGTVRAWASQTTVPVFVAATAKEADTAKPLFDATKTEPRVWLVPQQAVHGASMLRPDRNEGYETIWTALVAFLQQVAP